MGVGYAGGGLEDPGFDEDAAAKNLTDFSSYGPADTGVDAVSGGAPTAPGVTPAPGPAGPELMAPDLGEETPGLPPVPGPATTPTPPPVGQPPTPQSAAFDISLPEIPQRPQLTGNHEKDVALINDWQEKLADYHGKLAQASSQIQQKQAGALSEQAKKQLQVETANVAARKAAEAKAEAQSKRWQDAIDTAVKDKMAARKDLESGPDKLHGGQIVAAIFGAIGASLQNMAAIQAGHAGNYENQALNVINAKMKEGYERKKARLAAAGDELLEARYGAKDAADAHRIAMNDLDADYAANWRLVAKEAEARLRQLGIPEAQIKTNEVYVNALQKSAAAEGQIHEREANRQIQREHNAATENLARAHLTLARRTAEAVEGREQAKIDKEERGHAIHSLDTLQKDFKTDLGETGVAVGQGGAKGLLPTNRSLQKLLKAIDSDNPLSAKEAFLSFDQAARGGTATQGSVDALTKTLGGSAEQFNNWLESKKTGGLAPDSKKRFRAAVVEAIQSNLDAANDAHSTLNDKYNAPDYYNLKQHVESQFGVFNGFRDANGKQVFQVERDPNAPGIERTTGRRLAPRGAPAPRGTPEQAAGKPSKAQIDAAMRILDRKDVAPADKQAAIGILDAAGVL